MSLMIYNPLDHTFEGSAANGLNVRVDHATFHEEVDPHFFDLLTNGSGPDGQLTEADNAAYDATVAPIYTADYWAQKAG